MMHAMASARRICTCLSPCVCDRPADTVTELDGLPSARQRACYPLVLPFATFMTLSIPPLHVDQASLSRRVLISSTVGRTGSIASLRDFYILHTLAPTRNRPSSHVPLLSMKKAVSRPHVRRRRVVYSPPQHRRCLLIQFSLDTSSVPHSHWKRLTRHPVSATPSVYAPR